MRIRVFAKDANPAIDPPLFHVSKRAARKLVRGRMAQKLDEWSLRAGWEDKERKQSKWSQGAVYELAAIDKHPQFFHGGLTRTETQPNPKPGILTWGHIGETKQTPKPR